MFVDFLSDFLNWHVKSTIFAPIKNRPNEYLINTTIGPIDYNDDYIKRYSDILDLLY